MQKIYPSFSGLNGLKCALEQNKVSINENLKTINVTLMDGIQGAYFN
jgi:hypothetical protein